MFRSSDGSTWGQISASRLSAIEIWKGNRILDESHVARISESISSIKDLSLNPFRVVTVTEDGETTRYIIDGQHRISILKKYFTDPTVEDFDVVVIEIECSDESEIIDYFKIINTTKSMQWREDPVIVANKYIQAFCKEFNKDPKKPVVKIGKTNRPFLSVDKLRDALIQRHVVDWGITPAEFLDRCIENNDKYLQNLDTKIPMNKKAKELGFSLGLLDFKWI